LVWRETAVRPDEVYYLAAVHHAAEENRGGDLDLFGKSFDVNVRGMLNFLEAIRKRSPGTRLFYAASSHIFGRARTSPQDEQTPVEPACIYGITKATGLQCCRFYRQRHGVFAAVGILYNHESPYRRPEFVSQKIVRGALAIRDGRQSKLVLGDLDAQVDWGYAPDYVDAMTRILGHAAPEDFIVATGQLHSVREFAAAAFGRLGLDWAKYVEVDSSLVGKQKRALVGNADKLRSLTGWRPSVTFDQMVGLLIQAAAHMVAQPPPAVNPMHAQPGAAGPHLTTLVFIPTYNERENAQQLYNEIRALGLDTDVLFVDDNSPDGTGAVLDELAAKDPRLHVIHRPGKLGIGSAHRRGIQWAYDHGYERLVTMDCDFTHSPADIPRLLESSADHHIVVGSRYLRHGSLPGWNLMRRFITRFAHLLTRTLLKINHDASGAFRVYNLEKIPAYAFSDVRSQGYSFFFESMFLFVRNDFSIHDVPIVLPARTYGHSKMSLREATHSGFRILKLYAATWLNPEQFRFITPLPDVNPQLVDPQKWDEYWDRSLQATSLVYDIVATAYRELVIRRRLNHFIRRHFPSGARLLHAGCGSGLVDGDLGHYAEITALDISVEALQLYRKNNPQVKAVKHGSVLDLPFAEGSFDGVYNLGVMEHFAEPEVRRILSQLARVVKPGGKLVIFWPHAKASSVKVLGAVHWFLNSVLKRGVQLHPPEVSLLKSRAWAEDLFRAAGLDVVEYHFGPRDCFVQAVIVARKPDAGLKPDGRNA